MTTRKIRDELKKIYKERDSWDGGKGPFTPKAIRKRELVLIKQHLLYRIEDTKLLGDRNEEKFYLVLYKAVDDYLKELKRNGQNG